MSARTRRNSPLVLSFRSCRSEQLGLLDFAWLALERHLWASTATAQRCHRAVRTIELTNLQSRHPGVSLDQVTFHVKMTRVVSYSKARCCANYEALFIVEMSSFSADLANPTTEFPLRTLTRLGC